jgi:hypothetical protein
MSNNPIYQAAGTVGNNPLYEPADSGTVSPLYDGKGREAGDSPSEAEIVSNPLYTGP